MNDSGAAAVKSNCICRCAQNERSDARDDGRNDCKITPSNRRAISSATALSWFRSWIGGPPVS